MLESADFISQTLNNALTPTVNHRQRQRPMPYVLCAAATSIHCAPLTPRVWQLATRAHYSGGAGSIAMPMPPAVSVHSIGRGTLLRARAARFRFGVPWDRGGVPFSRPLRARHVCSLPFLLARCMRRSVAPSMPAPRRLPCRASLPQPTGQLCFCVCPEGRRRRNGCGCYLIQFYCRVGVRVNSDI